MRPGWWATLVAIAVAPVIVLLIVDKATTTAVDRTVPTHPTIQVIFVPSGTDQIRSTTARYTETVIFRADRPLHLTGLEVMFCPGTCNGVPDDKRIMLPPPAGTSLDIGTTARTITFRRVVPQQAYLQYVRYRLRGGHWQDLLPLWKV